MGKNSRYNLLGQAIFPGGYHGTAARIFEGKPRRGAGHKRVYQEREEQLGQDTSAGGVVLVTEADSAGDFRAAVGDRACDMELVGRLPQGRAGRFEEEGILSKGDSSGSEAGRTPCGDNEAGAEHSWNRRTYMELPSAFGLAGQDIPHSCHRRMGPSDSVEAQSTFPPSEVETDKSRPRLRTKKDAIQQLKTEFETGVHPGEKLLFLDECDLHLQPILGNNWQAAGCQNRVPAAGQNYKSYCFGAIDFSGAEVTYRIADHKRSGDFVEFLEALRQKYNTRLHLVLDNYSIHFSKEVKRYLSLYPGAFEFHFLPTYSPWLNPMETVWRELKNAVCRNHFHGCMANLKEAVHKYFASHAIHEGALRAAA